MVFTSKFTRQTCKKKKKDWYSVGLAYVNKKKKTVVQLRVRKIGWQFQKGTFVQFWQRKCSKLSLISCFGHI